MLFFYPRHEVAELVGGQLEVLDDVVQGSGEGVVVGVGKDVVDAAVLEEVLLNAKKKINEKCLKSCPFNFH